MSFEARASPIFVTIASEPMMISTENSGHRNFLIWQQAVPSGIVNALLNGGLAWLLFGQRQNVALGGGQGLIADTFVTAFLLVGLTTAATIALVRMEMRQGKIASFPAHNGLLRRLNVVPAALWFRSLSAGLVGAIVCGGLISGLLIGSGQDLWQGPQIILIKMIYTAMIGSATAVLVARLTLAEDSPGPKALPQHG